MQDITNELSALRKNLELLARIDKNARAKRIRVLSVSKSSPIHLDLVVYLSVGLALNKIIHGLLGNVSKIQDIRKQQEEIKSLKLANEREELILKELKAEEQSYLNPALLARDHIMQDTKKENIDGSESEVDKAVVEACKYFVKLFEEGSIVRVYLTAANTRSETHRSEDIGHKLIRERTTATNVIKGIQTKRMINGGEK